jgi:hypothetical protein
MCCVWLLALAQGCLISMHPSDEIPTADTGQCSGLYSIPFCLGYSSHALLVSLVPATQHMAYVSRIETKWTYRTDGTNL